MEKKHVTTPRSQLLGRKFIGKKWRQGVCIDFFHMQGRFARFPPKKKESIKEGKE